MHRERIVSDPEVLSGKARVRGTRVSVELLLEALADGETIDDLLSEYPFLEREDVLAALSYGAWSLRRELRTLGAPTPR